MFHRRFIEIFTSFYFSYLSTMDENLLMAISRSTVECLRVGLFHFACMVLATPESKLSPSEPHSKLLLRFPSLKVVCQIFKGNLSINICCEGASSYGATIQEAHQHIQPWGENVGGLDGLTRT